MFRGLRKFFRRRRLAQRTRDQSVEAAGDDAPPGPWTVRRWDAADTNRLNRAHWSTATGQPINADLAERLETLRARATYEAANNTRVEGVITPHAAHSVGPRGPTLQVQSDDEAYNTALEGLWRDWWQKPDATGQLSGAELLRCWVRSLWLSGEYLAQIVTDPDVFDGVSMRVLDIAPRRLGTPPDQAGDADIALGVRRKRTGKPTQYFIQEPTLMGPWELDTGKYDTVPADLIMHGFVTQEPGQVRGVPWLSTSLDVIADLRDYDAEVLDAARAAASMAVFWHTNHPDSEYLEVSESTEIERRTQSTGPPGWEPAMLTPQQPSTGYVDYRKEHQASIGRPVNMPLMLVRLTAERHNYSSARMDIQLYLGQLLVLQTMIESQSLNRLVDALAQEAELAGLLPRRPRRVTYSWTWPKPPHVDPQKEAQAEDLTMKNGTTTYTEALAARGKDLDMTIAQRLAEAKKLAKAELPPPPGAAPAKPKPAAEPEPAKTP